MLKPRVIPPEEQAELNQLLTADIDVLIKQLASEVGTLGSNNAQEQVESWIHRQHKKLYELICVEGQYCVVFANRRADQDLMIIAAVGDLLATAFSGLPYYTLSAMLVRRSLDSFCDCSV